MPDAAPPARAAASGDGSRGEAAPQHALFEADGKTRGEPAAPRPPAAASMALPPSPQRHGVAATPPPGEATHDIRLHDQLVAYRLRRTRRRSIGFTVGADGLTVAAPRWVGTAQIEAALRDKAGWVVRKLAEQRERATRLQASRVEWRDGSTLPFLGRTVRIVLDAGVQGTMLDAAATAEGAAASGGEPPALRVGLPASAGAVQIRDAVRGWLQRQARRIFEERCAHYAPRLGVRPRRLALSSARTRWGSASADGSVRLNWRLVHLPLPTIDYVVAHELAHLRHMDHGPQFWAVVRTVVADVDGERGTLRRAVLPPID